MGNLAVHMRIASLQISNDDVDTRQQAISELAETWGKLRSPNTIILKAGEIAHSLGSDGIPVSSLGEEVEGAVQRHASAFLYSERPLEVGVCAGIAIIEVMSSDSGTSGWTTADIFASALWSALDFQRPLEDHRREALRKEVLDAARAKALSAAETSRARSVVSDFSELAIVISEDTKATTSFKKATTSTITALRRNAALDREELDFLWWVQLGRSRILNRSFSKIDEPVRLITSGIEAAGHLRRLPCEVHREIVLRTLDVDTNLNLAEIIVAVGGDSEAIGKACESELIDLAPSVFPLVHALTSGETVTEGADVARSSSDWGARALWEVALIKLSANGQSTL